VHEIGSAIAASTEFELLGFTPESGAFPFSQFSSCLE
jgi:hypothetical protein